MSTIHDQICISLPAQASYARTFRMLAANLATVLRMNVEEVEDVRMAAEEAFVLACESAAQGIEASCVLFERGVSMELMLGPEDISESQAFQYADLILQAVAKTYKLTDKSLYLEMSAGSIDEFK